MFSFLEQSISNAMGVAEDLLEGELPSQARVSRLLADGLSVYAIAEITGIAVDVIQDMATKTGG